MAVEALKAFSLNKTAVTTAYNNDFTADGKIQVHGRFERDIYVFSYNSDDTPDNKCQMETKKT